MRGNGPSGRIFSQKYFDKSKLPKSDAVFFQGVCTYYSSANYKTVVGARGTGCCGAVINWGVVTAYKKCQNIYCTDQICPN